MKKSKELAIALVSGGMDSLATTAIAFNKHERIALLHLNYGQKTEQKELDCFTKIANHYQVPSDLRKVIDTTFFRQLGGSSLTDDKITVKTFDPNKNKEIPDSYVPFRNTHLIAMAVSWAEIIGAKKIYIGAVFEDSSGYPDCRPNYYKAVNKLIKEGTKKENIKVLTPVINMRKDKIVKKIIELNAPLQYTWSCYSNSNEACGVCDSCVLRLRGMEKAKIIDPIPYSKR